MMRIALTPWNPWFREPTLQKQHNRTPCQGRLVHPFGDAGLLAAQSADTPLLNNTQMPPGVRTILIEKCADRHSNQAHAPFYRHFAPASWLMERDIVEARKAMNLSLWDTYSADQRQTLAAEMVQQAKSREMPPMQYRMIHWNARIADADVRTFSVWVHGAQIMPATAMVAGAGDPIRGSALRKALHRMSCADAKSRRSSIAGSLRADFRHGGRFCIFLGAEQGPRRLGRSVAGEMAYRSRRVHFRQ
jgi:Haem-binding domain